MSWKVLKWPAGLREGNYSLCCSSLWSTPYTVDSLLKNSPVLWKSNCHSILSLKRVCGVLIIGYMTFASTALYNHVTQIHMVCWHIISNHIQSHLLCVHMNEEYRYISININSNCKNTELRFDKCTYISTYSINL